MVGALSWLLGSKFGRWGAFVVLACIAAWLALNAATRAGKRAEQARQMQARLKSLQTALRANNDVTNMSPDQRRDYVFRWVSDDAK